MDTIKVRNTSDKPMLVFLGPDAAPVVRTIQPGGVLDLGVYARRGPSFDLVGRLVMAYAILYTAADVIAAQAAVGDWLSMLVATACGIGYGLTLKGAWRSTS